MPLQPQVVPVPLFGGIDTKTDPKYVAATTGLTAQNVSFFGVQAARKRYGQTLLSNQIGAAQNVINSGEALGALDSELLAFTGTNLYGYASGQASWYNRGALTETIVDCEPIIRSSGSVNGIASFWSNLLELYAWEDTRGGVRYAVRDSQSGAFIISDSVLNLNGAMPKIVASGGYAYIFYSTPTQLRAAQFIQNDLGRGVIQTFVLVNGNIQTYGYAVASDPGAAQILLLYCSSADGTIWVANGYNPNLSDIATSGPQTLPAASTTVFPTGACNLGGDGGAEFWVVDSTNTMVTGFLADAIGNIFGVENTYVPPFPAGATIQALAGGPITTEDSAGDIQLYISAQVSGGQVFTAITSPANSLLLGTLYGLQVASNAVCTATQSFIILSSSLETIQGTQSQTSSFYLCGSSYKSDGTVLTVPFTILQRFQGSLAYTAGTTVPTLVPTTEGLFVGLAQRLQLRADALGTIYAQSGLIATYFTFPATSGVQSGTQIVPYGNEAIINCGNTYSYDGAKIAESGFWEFPQGITATRATAGSNMEPGQRQYCVTYEWTDATGAVCLSAPSYSSPINESQFSGGAPGTYASYIFTVNALPLVGDTFTVNGSLFTMIANSATSTLQNVNIGISLDNQAANIAAGINLVPSTLVTAVASGNTVTLMAIQLGTIGNTYSFSSALTGTLIEFERFGIYVYAGDQVTLTVPYTVLTLKTGVQVCLYRTVANEASPYYKVGSVSNDPGLTGAQSFQFYDSMSDIDIQSQQLLYAPPDGSGEIENDPPPPFLFVTATKTRAFGIAQDDRTALWYSKPLNSGRPAEWSSAQIVRIETAGGEVTGLSFLNTQAVIFKRSRAYYLPGDGPNSAGQPANGFPQTLSALSVTTGCINNKSILATTNGLIYLSSLGFEQLDQNLNNTATFGLPVQAYSTLNFTGCAAVPAQNQLRWVSTNGTAVVYDYVLQIWSTYTNYAAVGYTAWNNTFARLDSVGRVYYEDTSLYTDNLQPVQMLVETSWLKLASMAQGFGAVWYAEILGTYLSPHTLNIEVAYDYLDAPTQVSTFDATTYGNFGTYGSSSPYGTGVYGANITNPLTAYTTRYQPRVTLHRQVCEAVKFKIYDSSTTGPSCNLNEIALQLGVIGGLNRVPVTQQVG